MPYLPPIGIPAPTWGSIDPINDLPPSLPSPWNASTPGFYYVAAGGTAEDNGHPGNPRATIPISAAAGSVIVVEGPFTADQTSPNDFKMTGTAEAPVWIIAAEGENNTITGAWGFHTNASYIIIDGFNFDYSGGGGIEIAGDVYGICIRNGTLTSSGTVDGTTSNGISGVVAQAGSAYGEHGNFIFYNFDVSLCGDWLYAEGDPDDHGFAITTKFCEDVWILNCEISYCSGDAVQFIANTTLADDENGRRFYIGGCIAHHIAQAAFWVKRGSDIIMSQNTVHTIRRDTPSAPNAGGMGGQYGPKNFWCIFNTVYNCQTGFNIASSSLEGGTEGDVYIIGNVFYDIHDEDGDPDYDWRSNLFEAGGAAISIWSGCASATIVNNTIEDCDVGVISPASVPILINGNIMGPMHANGGHIITNADNELDTIGYNILAGDVYVQKDASVMTSIASVNSSYGPDNSNTAPAFVNAPGGNFNLSEGSNGINDFTASANAAYGTFSAAFARSILFDRAGNPRPVNNWDMGAYEFGSGPPPTAGEPHCCLSAFMAGAI